MSVDLGIWNTLSRLIILLVMLAGVLGLGIWYFPLIQKNERLRKEILQLNLEIKREEETARQLKSAIYSLQKDPKTVERLARERLGYAKPGESVIRFEAGATNPSTTLSGH